jgi:hypothetical protein
MAYWAKGVLLFTDDGIRLISLNPRNSRPWTREECFKYCNPTNIHSGIENRINRLKLKSSLINSNNRKEKDWYTDITNFKDVEIQMDTVRW